MLWAGIIILVVGLLWSVFKDYVVWDAAHDLYNGGGVPTLGFPTFCPIPIPVGLSLVLKATDLYPFFGFGFVVYLCLAAVFGALYWLFDRLGEPERQRQWQALKQKTAPGEAP